ncbi:hypothetical protein ACSBL2_15805 [Pedobacter sp. AW31-3R]|uniref:hypothetical protein n=1 Tax=Pedobacter sp. AW31-3R TaxID=3445781 RepID=UPI003FA10A88
MEDIEIISLWKSYDEKLTENLAFSRENASEITKMKVRSFLSRMKPVKFFAVLTGIAWVIFVDSLLIHLLHVASPFFLISAGLQVLIIKMAIGVYLYQLILLHRADVSESILETQELISRLKISTLWVARILFLQLPLWTTFYWNRSMLTGGNIWLYSLQIMVTLFFAGVAAWLFVQVNYENTNKKWFRLLFNGKEWTPLFNAMEILSQVKEYKQ